MNSTYINEMIMIYRVLEDFTFVDNVDDKIALLNYLKYADIKDKRSIGFKDAIIEEMERRINHD